MTAGRPVLLMKLPLPTRSGSGCGLEGIAAAAKRCCLARRSAVVQYICMEVIDNVFQLLSVKINSKITLINPSI